LPPPDLPSPRLGAIASISSMNIKAGEDIAAV